MIKPFVHLHGPKGKDLGENRNMRTKLIASLALAALVTGCASPSQPRERMVVDSDKVAIVEKVARENGTHVTWVNPPQKRTRGP